MDDGGKRTEKSLYVLVGLPGAGKSTLAERLQREAAGDLRIVEPRRRPQEEGGRISDRRAA